MKAKYLVVTRGFSVAKGNIIEAANDKQLQKAIKKLRGMGYKSLMIYSHVGTLDSAATYEISETFGGVRFVFRTGDSIKEIHVE